MTLPKCTCGTSGTVVNCRPAGTWAKFFDSEGEYLEDHTDGLYAVPSKTIRCADCNKIRRDLELRMVGGYYGGRIVERNEQDG